jgi:hypothetical protein
VHGSSGSRGGWCGDCDVRIERLRRNETDAARPADTAPATQPIDSQRVRTAPLSARPLSLCCRPPQPAVRALTKRTRRPPQPPRAPHTIDLRRRSIRPLGPPPTSVISSPISSAAQRSSTTDCRIEPDRSPRALRTVRLALLHAIRSHVQALLCACERARATTRGWPKEM